MLSRFGVTPYFVFDGDYLPSKAGTEADRLKQRENAKKLGSELLALGRTKQAHQTLNAAVDITPEMAAAVILELRRQDIAYIVAPYEADAQLAYLEQHGHVDAVMAEDSDLLVFGVKCLITKLDQHGNCIVFERKNFAACRGASLAGWTDKDFRHMAILSGCDYLPNLKSIGLNRAHSLMRRHKTIDRVLQSLKFEGKVTVPSDYLARFMQADLTFLYHFVFCPEKQEMVHLNPLESSIKLENMPFLGQWHKPRIAAAVARAELHPQSRQPLVPYPESKYATQRPGYAPTHVAQVTKTKAIESFFQAKRTQNTEANDLKRKPTKSVTVGRIPLAELDPNSFVMTARQVEVQRQPLPPQTPQTQSDENAPRRPAPFIARTPMTTTTSSHKKRLCFDETINQLGNQTSKFFTPARQKKRKSSPAFSIHSDGSDAAAFWALATPDVSASATEQIIKLVSETSPLDNGADLEATLVDDTEGFEEMLVEDDLVGQTFVEEKTNIFEKFSLKLKSLANETDTPAQSHKRKASQSPVASPASSRSSAAFEDNVVPESVWDAAKELLQVAASETAELLSSSAGQAAPMCGSEDFLVPGSDDGELETPVKPTLNLSRFAYETL
jgi:exonuclease 1